jgi:hypothetical protein
MQTNKSTTKTAITYPFTALPNEIVASTAPSDALKLLAYMLLRQGIHGWKMRKSDLCKTLGMSLYAVKKALKWLQKHCYASFTRAYGFTHWVFTATPATRVLPESVDIQPVEQVNRQPILNINKEKEIKKETTTQAVVVSSEKEVDEEKAELIYPEKLTTDQKKAAKSVIKKVKQPELKQPVLLALAYYLTQGTVKNPIAYLNGLITRANNGTFEAIEANTGKANKPTQWQHPIKAPPVDNNLYFQGLNAKYGSKAEKATISSGFKFKSPQNPPTPAP